MTEISLLAAFSAGLLSFLSPCVLPVVPAFLASLSGPGTFAPTARRITIFLHSLNFVLGFSAVFVILGAGAGLLGSAISSHLSQLRQIAGSLLVVFGLFLLAAWKIPWLNYQKRLTRSQVTTGHARSLLTGAVFSLGWTPCVGPILGGILSLALTSETVWHGAYLLSLYSLGMGLPFLIVGAVSGAVTPLLPQIRRYSPLISIISAVLLITVGLLMLTNKLTWFQAQLIR